MPSKFSVSISRKEVEVSPDEQKAIYRGIVEILREYRAWLLTPVKIPLKMEVTNPLEKGEDHD